MKKRKNGVGAELSDIECDLISGGCPNLAEMTPEEVEEWQKKQNQKQPKSPIKQSKNDGIPGIPTLYGSVGTSHRKIWL